MPKTWDKSFNWILDTKQAFDKNYAAFEEKINKVEKQEDVELNQISKQIQKDKKQLTIDHDQIMQQKTEIQAKRDELDDQIEECTKAHDQCVEEIDQAKISKAEKKNMIATYESNIENKEEIKETNTSIKEEISKAVDHADTKIEELGSKLGDNVEFSDLKTDFKQAKIKIENQETDLDEKNGYLKSQLNEQNELFTTNVNELCGSHIETIKSNGSFIKESEQKVANIEYICSKMEMSKIPRYDNSGLKEQLKRRDKSFRDLENERNRYMKL